MSRSVAGAVPADATGTQAPVATQVARGLTRLALGWFLFYQGWSKVTQELGGGLGSFHQSDMFQGNLPVWVPGLVALPYAYLLPWAELVFGALLAVGLFHRVSAGAATLMFVTIGLAWLDAGNLLPRHQLMVFAPLAAYLFFTGPGRFSLDAWRQQRREGGI